MLNAYIYKKELRSKEGEKMQEKAIVAISTPPGKGGIACVRISGEKVFEIAEKVFNPAQKSKKISKMEGYTAVFGHFTHGTLKDECIALVYKAPKSYTGEDVVEFFCHGGEAVAKELLIACIETGAKPAEAGEFTKRAFLNGKMSLTQAEAVIDLIDATSRQGVLSASFALEGALYNRIKEKSIIPLTEVAGHLAAYTDFPDEDVPELEEETLKNTLQKAEKELQNLIKTFDTGAVMRRGIETVIVGSPNVGKSTLLNLFSGYERAIVTNIPGTTRDVVEQVVSIGGIELILSDTAGIRKTDDEVEKAGIMRAYGKIEQVKFVISVFDGSLPVTAEDVDLAKLCESKAFSLAIINKADLKQKFKQQEIEKYFKKVIVISAKEEGSLKQVEESVLEVIGISEIDVDAGILANTRQLSAAQEAWQAVVDASDALQSGFTLDAVGVCIDDALAALYELTGETVSELVVEEIFSKFCVGK